MKSVGHVTSSYCSAALGRSIALAMVAGGRARIGQTLYVPMPGGDIAVEVTAPVFYDPDGARLNACLIDARHRPALLADRARARAAAGRASSCGGDGAARAAAGRALGMPVPARLPRREHGARAALWLGPDEWLLLAAADDAAAERALASALAACRIRWWT